MYCRSFSVAEGQQRVTCLTLNTGWIAASVECEHLGSWCVCAIHVKNHFSVPLLRLLCSISVGPVRCRPVDLSISDDGFLAITTDLDGVRVFKLSEHEDIPCATLITTFRAKRQTIHNSLQHMTYMNSGKWIGLASSVRALAVKFTDLSRCEDVVQVFGNIEKEASTGNLVVSRVVHTINGGITQFDACSPGLMAVVMGQSRELHLFRLQPGDVFGHKRVQLNLHTPDFGGVPHFYTCTALALGEQLAVVAYHFPQCPEGVVDVFSGFTGALLARRIVPCGITTALSTRGEQVMVGISGWSTTSSTEESPGHEESSSALYTFNAHSCANMGIYKGADAHPVWPARSIYLGKGEWCYARTGVGQTSGKRITVIDHAILPMSDLGTIS